MCSKSAKKYKPMNTATMPQVNKRQSPRKVSSEPVFQPRRVADPFRVVRKTSSFDKLEQILSGSPSLPPLKALPPLRYASPDQKLKYSYYTREYELSKPSLERLYFSDRTENPYLHSTLLRASPEKRAWSDPIVAIENAWNIRPDAGYRDHLEGTYRSDLQIEKLDLLCNENASVHHTSKFEQINRGNLVVRRGQRFDIYIKFNREVHQKFDQIRFVFDTGTHPSYEKGTFAEFNLNDDKRKQWHADVVQQLSQIEYIIGITPPPYCIASGWRLTVQNLTVQNGNKKSFVLDRAGPIYILFNPWCKDDSVYFPDSNLLEEYIENDSGAIFMGNYKQIGAKPWFFGQFEDGVLENCLYCLHKAFDFKFEENMGNPVVVTKALSRIISAKDKGILTASWTTNHYGGTPPLQWTGSVGILNEYMEFKKPVRYGQCFVFAGVITTICRAIGIPCRCVSNFSSAHDTRATCKVDVYWDWQNMKKLDATKDSIWSFHAWNDVWMRRDDDLAPNFSGWQAIDATPQEINGGTGPCGPASLVAIKTGNSDLQHDTKFMFAELNADRINYSNYGNSGKWQVQSADKDIVGKMISTKIPDGKPCQQNMIDVETFRFDVTGQYKYEDEIVRERLAPMREVRSRFNKPNFFAQGNQDIVFEGFMDRDFILIGSSFEASGLLKNTGHRSRTVEGRITCESVTYMGHRINVIKQQGFRGVIKPNQDCQISMDIECGDYITKLTPHTTMRISLMMRVIETGQYQAWQDEFRLRRPDLKIEVMTKNIMVGQPFECRFSFHNPLPETHLRNCSLIVDGPGLREGQKVINIRDVAPGELWSATLKLSTRKPGIHQLTASFNSHQIEDVSGVATIEVV